MVSKKLTNLWVASIKNGFFLIDRWIEASSDLGAGVRNPVSVPERCFGIKRPRRMVDIG